MLRPFGGCFRNDERQLIDTRKEMDNNIFIKIIVSALKQWCL